ncbi:hypothetical protein A5787_05115 [Mycobacterium sp. 852002-50816_SCH5313054-b]|uniref:DUF732 domain-containing protein n=1 Tax=Mycobacterium sp. 852002-50816_SCH5313054-b TaxID=1834092 RepID=UPI0007FB7FA7|nr:DUF732 domain-containing protein [Mycobacterium sp. 852002-50816_SCH5313054-b]OBF54364.1 hypothetical protein A5787_05115 [Mycobacterium sp. 852002-50816_SCH5313054-b]
MNVGPGKWSTVCAALLSAALFSAATASADPTDDAFIAALENYGIDTGDRDAAIAHGHAVCAALDRGQDSSVIALKLIKDPQINLSTKRQAGFFVGDSVASYCPQYRGSVDPSVIWLLPFPPMM